MNRKPDWITGGDPIRTHWSAGVDLLESHELTWQPMGEWMEGGVLLVVSRGLNKEGKTAAIRYQGRLAATARNLVSEIGWCQDADSPPHIQAISPKIWNEAWMAYLHGEITEDEMISRLCDTHANPSQHELTFRPYSEQQETAEHRWCWLSRMMPWALGLIVLMLVIGHMAARNAIWLYSIPPVKFNPVKNYISDYAYRSPLWILFILSMYMLAVLLGCLSLRLYHWGREQAYQRWRVFLCWLAAVFLGYAGLKMVEVAVYPVKPPEVTVEQIQREMDKPTLKRFSDAIYSTWMKLNGKGSKKTPLHKKIEMITSNSHHIVGIAPAMLAIMVSMVLCFMLTPAAWLHGIWKFATFLSSIFVIISLPALGLFGDAAGLGQRIGFLGVGIWLYLMSRIFSYRKSGIPHFEKM